MYLDSELGPETTFEISSHLQECSNCRRVAEQEARLENRLRTALRKPRPEDDAIWERSMARIGKSRSGRRTPIVGIGVTALALAATIALHFLIGAPWFHDELDLAEVTAAEHSLTLSSEGAGSGEGLEADELNAFFRRELSPAYCLEVDTAIGTRLIEAGICELANVRTAHVVCADSQTVLSLFWLPSEAITEFPETAERFQKYGSSFHCHVEPYEFFANKSGTGIIVGIAKTTPAMLEKFVQRAAMGACQGGA
ncbi:MAG: zf-HC2 domain-containing protein [Candidatus Zixiibacteriota bacterium]